MGGILEKVLIGNVKPKPTDDKPTDNEEPEIVDFLAFNIRSTKSDAL